MFWTTWTIRLRFKSNNYKRFRCTKQKWHRRPRVNPFTLYLLYLRRHFDFSGSLRLRCGLCFTLACRLCFGSSGCGGRSGCGCNRWGTSRRRLTLGFFGRWFSPLIWNICTQLKSRLPKYLHDRGWFSLIRELNEVIDLIWDSGFKLGITTSLLSSSLAPIDSRCYDTGEILVSTNLTQWLHSNLWLLDQGWMGKNMTWVVCTWKQRSTVGKCCSVTSPSPHDTAECVWTKQRTYLLLILMINYENKCTHTSQHVNVDGLGPLGWFVLSGKQHKLKGWRGFANFVCDFCVVLLVLVSFKE